MAAPMESMGTVASSEDGPEEMKPLFLTVSRERGVCRDLPSKASSSAAYISGKVGESSIVWLLACLKLAKADEG